MRLTAFGESTAWTAHTAFAHIKRSGARGALRRETAIGHGYAHG